MPHSLIARDMLREDHRLFVSLLCSISTACVVLEEGDQTAIHFVFLLGFSTKCVFVHHRLFGTD